MLQPTEARQKPDWLKIRPPGGEKYAEIKRLLRTLKLHTVCEEASCPNVAECWSQGTATIMLLGDLCTRACRFCNVKSGNPQARVDKEEPAHVAEAVTKLGLSYVVLTSVDRDDLSDGGAEHFALTIRAIKERDPNILVEVLTPDFLGQKKDIETVLEANPDVFAHNLETVERLTPGVRDHRCNYRTSLETLRVAKETKPSIFTKSALMLGIGEEPHEILLAMDDLKNVGVDLLTVGQYLRPTSWHLEVQNYIHPSVFKEYEIKGKQKGFAFVASGPLVRSSYRAGEFFVRQQVHER